jgi:hypothetical protein
MMKSSNNSVQDAEVRLVTGIELSCIVKHEV